MESWHFKIFLPKLNILKIANGFINKPSKLMNKMIINNTKPQINQNLYLEHLPIFNGQLFIMSEPKISFHTILYD